MWKMIFLFIWPDLNLKKNLFEEPKLEDYSLETTVANYSAIKLKQIGADRMFLRRTMIAGKLKSRIERQWNTSVGWANENSFVIVFVMNNTTDGNSFIVMRRNEPANVNWWYNNPESANEFFALCFVLGSFFFSKLTNERNRGEKGWKELRETSVHMNDTWTECRGLIAWIRFCDHFDVCTSRWNNY